MAGVSIRDIYMNFGRMEVLRGISLDVQDGEFMTLVGPSGCGKSTLLRILAGLENQTSGEVYIGGRRVDGSRPKDRDVAMVFQSYALYPHLKVFDNIAVPLQMRRFNTLQRFPVIGRFMPGRSAIAAEISEAVHKVAKGLHIEHLLDRKPGQLSGGQRQRVALGRAMVRNPQVFLMDEPLSNLDAKLRVQMRAELAGLHRRLAATFIYVTHDQAEAMTMSDRVALMTDGEILQCGEPYDIYRDPANRRVAEFIGSPKINILPGAVTSQGCIDVLGCHLPVKVDLETGAKVDIGVRPEAVAISMSSDAKTLKGRVYHRENLGPDVLLHIGIDCMDDPVIARLDPETSRQVSIGSEIFLEIPPGRTLVFAQDGNRVQIRRAEEAVVND